MRCIICTPSLCHLRGCSSAAEKRILHGTLLVVSIHCIRKFSYYLLIVKLQRALVELVQVSCIEGLERKAIFDI